MAEDQTPFMEVETLRSYLENPEEADRWLLGLRLRDPRVAYQNLLSIARQGVPLDLLTVLAAQMEKVLPELADPDMALNNLERFFTATRNPLSLASLFERDPGALAPLMQIFSSSQFLSEILICDPESYDLLRLTEGQPVARQTLIDELTSEIAALNHENEIMAALRRFKRREILRIAYGDFVCGHSLPTVTRQISYLADALLEAAYQAARQKLRNKLGEPRTMSGSPARFVILAMGKLGGVELNYSSDIDVVFLYEEEGSTDGPRSVSNAEYFQRLVQEIVRLLTFRTELGAVYRVDRRLSPEGEQGPAAISVPAALRYYDMRGRTWERQAYIKARPAAGDLDLGFAFLEQLEPWIYRRYLTRADISGIKTLRRKIEQRARSQGDVRDVKNGSGGIRDVEFVIQFLQLLHGADLPSVRTGNTLDAIAGLEQAGCLTHTESAYLQESYNFLRKLEHRLQIMFDLQTHTIPQDAGEIQKLAVRMGYHDSPGKPASEAFEADYHRFTFRNRQIINHLLHDAFRDEAETSAEVELVLDPEPTPDFIQQVLSRHRFRNPEQAYRNLMSLAEERVPFLSTRRCRHFLASIAPMLLSAISTTPDPDATLVTLGQVSDSLGGKGVLWELFSFSPPSLKLYVQLCAYTPFLASLLISNPGMIDSLMDSLVLDRLPSREFMENTLRDLCLAAEDIDPILHAFKNDHLLQIGVRDLLGKDDVEAITRTISELAETCLMEIVVREYEHLVLRYGQPTVEEGPDQGRRAEMVILALGKFGGQEMNYQSDLDLVFLYEGEGHTVPVVDSGYARRGEVTTNQHFFSELTQRIIRRASYLGPHGRLYQVDARLRPTGRSGSLVFTLGEFRQYFESGQGQLWERQALCKARPAVVSPRMEPVIRQLLQDVIHCRPWQSEHAGEIAAMRRRLEETAKGLDIKRGRGGIVDIEFLVQMLQLRHGSYVPQLRMTSTLAALRSLRESEILDETTFKELVESYHYLRTLENRMQLVAPTTRSRLPDNPVELARLSHLMGAETPPALIRTVEAYLARNRQHFERIVEKLANERIGSEILPSETQSQDFNGNP